MSNVVPTNPALPANLQGEPATAQRAKGVMRTLDQLDLAPLEARMQTLVRKQKVDRMIAWENMMFSLYAAQRAANKEAGRPDTPTALVGPDKFTRTNWGEELIALQALCLKTGRTVQEFRILLHPEESKALLMGFEAGFKACMLELKKQLGWTDAPVAPKVIGIGEQRTVQTGHDPAQLQQMQLYNEEKRKLLIAAGVIKPTAISHKSA